MDTNNTGSDIFRFSDPRQERIYRRLLLIGDGPASFYRDACGLMAPGTSLVATTHLVSHVLREIESAVRAVLQTAVSDASQSLGQPPEESGVRGQVELEGARVPGVTAAGDELTRLRAEIGDLREQLAERQRASEDHRAQIRAILAGLAIPESDPVGQSWLRFSGQYHKYAHRDALAPPRPVSQEFRDFWHETGAILDILLEKFESHYLASHALLDTLLGKASPTRGDAKVLRNRVPNNPVSLGYFFGRLGSPAWLDPLRKEAFFTRPPEPVPDREQGTVAFPRWPELQYLARMAPLNPETVLDISLRVPPTENISVHVDLADVALGLPPALASRLAEKAEEWIASPYHFHSLLPQKLGQLVVHLSTGGQVSTALDLARVLLAVLPDPRVSQTDTDGAPELLVPEPRARFDAWDYGEVLRRHVPALVNAAGVSAVEMLCALLDNAVRLSSRRDSAGELRAYSSIWRPAIEEQDDVHIGGLRSLLVSAVRDATLQIARRDPAAILALIGALEIHPWPVFRRLTLYLLSRFADAARSFVAQMLTDRKLFDDAELRHEYYLLAREGFGHLTEQDQARVLGWIEAGPDFEYSMQRWIQDRGEAPPPEVVTYWGGLWRRDRLAPLAGHLKGDWKRRYQGLVRALGEPQFHAFTSITTSWVGASSPKTADELGAMSVEELTGFLREWRADREGLRSPSLEGLGNVLSGIVGADPERFADQAERFEGLDPTYVRSLLYGLRDALTQGRLFRWEGVLALCRWVVGQPLEEVATTDPINDRDPGWTWTRKAIADLLSRGLESDALGLPVELRRVVWEVLQPLTLDPEPTPEYEAEYGGSNMDPATLSINTTRGQAMHAVVRYALWVRRHYDESEEGQGQVSAGFDAMPEVREALEYHLDPANDPSPAVRAVYGQWFYWLALLDRGWSSAHVPAIFPTEPDRQDLRDAAWEAHLVYGRLGDASFEPLRQEYARAVERISATSSEVRRPIDPDARLAEHIVVLYAHGVLNLARPDGLVSRFFAAAPDQVRGHALSFTGQWVLNATKPIASDILARLKSLWEGRLAAARTSAPSPRSPELTAFGWWFASGKFDDNWAITQLVEALEIAHWAEPDHLVVKRLSELSSELPRETVRCLRLLVEGDKERWHVLGWREDARAALSTALRGSDDVARQAAVELVNILGARGYLEFADLLVADH